MVHMPMITVALHCLPEPPAWPQQHALRPLPQAAELIKS